MAELADVKELRSLLDVGCGSGMALRYLLGSGRSCAYCGIDLNASRLHGRFLPGNYRFEDIDLDDDWDVGRFDVAWCSEVLEHLFDDVGVLGRIVRSVRPGGRIILTMPSAAFVEAIGEHVPEILELSATQDGGHVRKGYTREGIHRLADAVGCQVLRVGAISRCTIPQMRARYAGRPISRLLSNTKYVNRSEPDAFLRDIGEDDQLHRDYSCVSAVLSW